MHSKLEKINTKLILQQCVMYGITISDSVPENLIVFVLNEINISCRCFGIK